MADVKDDSGKDVVVKMEMSRGLDPELTLPLDELREYKLYNSTGDGYWFGDMHRQKKTIFVFIRHFLCFVAKEYVEDLALIPKAFFDEANVRLVVIGCGPYKYIEPFREATGFMGLMFTDPSRELYNKLGLKPKMESTLNNKASKHIKSGFVMGTMKSLFRGLRYHESQGDYNQQGGSFIIGPGDAISHIHRDRSPVDHVVINDLLGMAGVQQVNYPGDTRVMYI